MSDSEQNKTNDFTTLVNEGGLGYQITSSYFHEELMKKEAVLKEIAKYDPNIDMCDSGHRFVKLPDHPVKDGKARCPYCMATGLDLLRSVL